MWPWAEAEPGSGLKEVLSKALGILVAVEKRREIYFIDNIKFHIDEVEGLGFFVEIEAIDESGEIGREILLEQCRSFIRLFGIEEKDLIDRSYSDLLLEKNK
jgi:adenylate cyclase class 2